MNLDQYLTPAQKTAPSPYQYTSDVGGINDRLCYNGKLLHGAIGACTETGELLDAVKKHVYYGKPLDTTNIEEEVGDVLWYLAEVVAALKEEKPELTFQSIIERNVAKLHQRYNGGAFDPDFAINRDLELERTILEG